MIRLLVADDQDLVRAGFRAMLAAQPDMDVVGEAGTGRETIELATRLRPDVALIDVRMPDLDGIAATRAITTSGSTCRVVMLTTFDLDEYVYAAFHAAQSASCSRPSRPRT